MGMSWRNRFIIGLTLFSMFFGVGNLIDPVFLGARAGEQAWQAYGGFAVTAVLLPVAAMAVVARCGSLERLAGRVHPLFARVFALLLYLAMGPFLAIPRAASMSFEMALAPFLDSRLLDWFRPGYALLFYSLAVLIARKPERLWETLGRITGPCLLAILILFGAGVLSYSAGDGAAADGIFYGREALTAGLAEGALTWDALAALCFGLVLGQNIRQRGVSSREGIVRETILAACFAGVLLAAFYALLTRAGALAGALNPDASGGAVLLSGLVRHLFGGLGTVLLGAVFVLACLNTCAGLLSCCGAYFHSLAPEISGRRWGLLLAAWGLLNVCTGWDLHLEFAVPVLYLLYPAAVLLLLLALLPGSCRRLRGLYPLTVGFAVLFRLAETLELVGIRIPLLTESIACLPLARQGFGWVCGAGMGALLSLSLSLLPQRRRDPCG